jgi:hypothetical protein
VADVIGGWSIWDHYANAFSAREGSCWRRVYEGDGTGRPMSCPEPVEWRGRYRTRTLSDTARQVVRGGLLRGRRR